MRSRGGKFGAIAGSAGLLLAAGCSTASQEVQPPPPKVEISTCTLTPHWLGWNSLRVTVSDPALKASQRIVGAEVSWGNGAEESQAAGSITAKNIDVPGLSDKPYTYPNPGNYVVAATVEIRQGGKELRYSGYGCLLEANVSPPGTLPNIDEGP